MNSTGCRLNPPILSKVGFGHQIRGHIFSFCVLFLFIFGCGYPERPKVITTSSIESFRPSSPREVNSVEQALAAIITVCREDLKLPIVKSFEAKLYKNSQSFASFGVDWRAFPVDVADVAAFAGGTKMHIDLQKINANSGWATFIWLLAHEYGHNIHYEVAGVIPRTHAWFNEGFAEWVAAKTFDALGWQDYHHSIHRVTQETSRQLDLLPRLASLHDIQAWRRTSGFTHGRIRTYSLALVAIDRLIQGKKLASAVQLLSANVFNEHFGNSYDHFDQDLTTYLVGQRRHSNDDDRIDSPRWKAGDKWSYELRRPGQKVVVEREFIRRDTFAGIPSYVIKTGAAESFYAIDSLALIATKKNGRYTYRVSNIDQVITWPLRANKEWQNNFTRENIEVGATRTVRLLMRVVGFENVEVKAGILRTVKIEAYGYSSGRLLAEYWYSPQAKWFAKSRIYDRDFSLVEEELVSFKVQ
jgi:hypothetical protein